MAQLDPTLPGVTYGMYPQEVQQDVAANARKRAIAEALLSRGLAGSYRPGQPYSWTQGLGDLASAYVGTKNLAASDEAGKAIAGRYQTGLEGAIKRFQEKTQGLPGDTAVPDDLGGGPVRPPTPGDPYSAATEAIASGYGPMAAIGTNALKELSKGTMLPKDYANLAKDFTAESVTKFALGGGRDPSILVKRPELGAAGDTLYNKETGTITPTQTYGDPKNVAPLGTPPIIAATSNLTNKPIPLRGTTSVTQSVDTKGSTKFAEKMNEQMAKELEDSKTGATAAVKDMTILTNASDAFNKGIKTGSAQGLRNEIDKAAATLGFKSSDPKISNTDLFVRGMTTRIMQHTKELRPLSDTDRLLLEDVLAGKSLDEGALRHFLDLSMDANVQILQNHRQLLENAQGLEGFPKGAERIYDVGIPSFEDSGRKYEVGPPPGAAVQKVKDALRRNPKRIQSLIEQAGGRVEKRGGGAGGSF